MNFSERRSRRFKNAVILHLLTEKLSHFDSYYKFFRRRRNNQLLE